VRVFGSKRDEEATGGSIKLHSEKSFIMTRNAYKILVGNPEGKELFWEA
jgi:hypothetical protein